jgi:hypothetical protein
MNDLNAVLAADSLARERVRSVLAARDVPERRTSA